MNTMNTNEKQVPIIEQIKESTKHFFEPLNEQNAEWGINYQVVGLCAAMIAGAYFVKKALTPKDI